MRKEIESRSDCPTVAFARFVPRTRDSDPCPAWRCRLVRGHRCPEPPFASARGSGPGCQPFGWGTGSAHFWPRNDVCRLWHHRPIGRGTRGAYRCEARPNSIWVRASRNTRPQWFVGSCIVNWTGASIDQNVQRFFECSKASLADDRRHDFRRRHRRPLLARRHRSYCQGHHAGLVVDQLSDKLRWRDDGNATLPK